MLQIRFLFPTLTMPYLRSLLVFLILCLSLGAIGGMITATSVENWYPYLLKPAGTPPDWVFAPVWTTLYVLIAVSGWLIWRAPESAARRHALTLYGVQLGLNLLWSALFFGLERPDLALGNIVLLWFAIDLVAVRFWALNRHAALLLAPYKLWVCYATYLNAGIWWLNQTPA